MSELKMKQMDPTKVIANIGGLTPRAYADGSMISIEFDTPKRTKHIGLTGQGRHIKSADRSGTVTIRLASYSPTVAGIAALDTADVPFSIAVVDKSSNGDSFFAGSCTLMQEPAMVWSENEEALEYQFQFIKGKMIRVGAEADGLLAALSGLIPGL